MKHAGTWAIFATLLAGAGIGRAEDRKTPTGVLLEKGIFQEDTAGDIDAAMRIYRRIVQRDQANRRHVAQAHYRLGMCHLRKKQTPEAKKSLRHVIEKFPEQKGLVAKARAAIAEAAGLEFQPVPWRDGERMEIRLATPGGTAVGKLIYSAASVRIDEKDLWRLDTWRADRNGHIMLSRVDVRKDTFAPVASSVNSTLMGRFESSFTPAEIRWQALRPKGDAPKNQLAVTEVAYDNEQVIQLIRRLPLAPGYAGTFPLYSPFEGKVMTCRIRGTGREKITVPAGEFDCHKIAIEVMLLDKDEPFLTQIAWYSADKHRYLVKIDAGGALMLLEKVSVAGEAKAQPFHDKATGLSLTVPAGWEPIRLSGKSSALVLRMLSPDASGTITAKARDLGKNDPSVRKLADKARQRLAKLLKDYKPGAMKDVRVAGAAVRSAATYTQLGWPMTRHTVVLVKGKTVVTLACDSRTDAVKANLARFEDVLASLHVGQGRAGQAPPDAD